MRALAIRNILTEGNEILTKKSKKVEQFDENLFQLLDDLKETILHYGNCAGLAAPQVGVLKRVTVINTRDNDGMIELINPEIIESSGEQIRQEGCMSFPGKFIKTARPLCVKVRSQNRFGEEQIHFVKKFEAQAFHHEIDHLNGVLMMSRLVSYIKGEGA